MFVLARRIGERRHIDLALEMAEPESSQYVFVCGAAPVSRESMTG